MTATVVFILRNAFSIILYFFIGWALWTLWKTFSHKTDSFFRASFPHISLMVLEKAGENQVHTFNKNLIFIGRDPTVDLPISDSTISARHAKLSYHHNNWWLEDLNSTNGSFLNETEVSTAIVLTNGDRLRCGQIEIMVKIS